jgi:predicted AlkP superfamily pyrophosphatase or phosphodiesterase
LSAINLKTKNKHLILLGVDGVRSDVLNLAIDRGYLPNFKSFISSGYSNFSVQSLRTTLSVPCWKSILTGRVSHGLTQNNYIKHKLACNTGTNKQSDIKHIQHVLIQNLPFLKTQTITSWNKLHIEHLLENKHGAHTHYPEYNYSAENSGIAINLQDNSEIKLDPSSSGLGDLSEMGLSDKYHMEDLDEKVFNKTMQSISLDNDDVSNFLFSYLDNIDSRGHYGKGGFSIDNPEYKKALEVTDRYLGEISSLIKARCELYKNEQWLIVIVTDHGGIKSEEVNLTNNDQVGCMGHGQDTFHERSTFILLNEFVSNDKNLSNSDILDLANLHNTEDKSITASIADIPLIVYDYFGIPTPENIDSKRFVDIRDAKIKSTEKSKSDLIIVPSLYSLALAKYRESTPLGPHPFAS